MMIDGEAIAGEASFDVVNPATGVAFARAPDCTRAQLDRAMAAAARAYPRWAADGGARRAALHRIADRLEAAADELAPLLTAEQGKTIAAARGEIVRSASWFRYYAGVELPGELLQDDASGRIEIVHRPLGVVAAITPWNVPIMLASWKLAPALMAGNTVVLKPSPYTPLSTLAIGNLIAREMPPGVLNVVSGGNELGAWMTAHPVPRKVSFTGSVATGKRVATTAAADLKRLTLELGGNDPAILLDDVDVASVAKELFWRGFANNGQVCMAIKRIYVPDRLYDDVVDAMSAIADSIVIGDGALPDTQLGPINNSPQRARIAELVADAVSVGGRIAAGGTVGEGSGYFYRPTIVADVSDGMRIVDEEQFGPALPLIRYNSIDDAVARANATHFGLGASVWGTDLDRAADVADRFDCGTSWVNDHMVVAPHQPFGGSKWSGIGVESGLAGLAAYTEAQVRCRPSAHVKL